MLTAWSPGLTVPFQLWVDFFLTTHLRFGFEFVFFSCGIFFHTLCLHFPCFYVRLPSLTCPLPLTAYLLLSISCVWLFATPRTAKAWTTENKCGTLPPGPRWRRQWHPTPVLLPGRSHGRRSLVGCSPWGRKESDTTERLHFHFSLSCTGEGNGNPLQRSCLENPRDGGAWWAAVYGVAQSRTRLKRLSSSSSP